MVPKVTGTSDGLVVVGAILGTWVGNILGDIVGNKVGGNVEQVYSVAFPLPVPGDTYKQVSIDDSAGVLKEGVVQV